MDIDEVKKEADKYNAQTNANITPGLGGMAGVCPNCGRCPTCGRGGYYNQPQYPHWWSQPQIICSSPQHVSGQVIS